MSNEVPDDYVIFQHPTLDLVRAIRDHLMKTHSLAFTIEVQDDQVGVAYVLRATTVTGEKLLMMEAARSFEKGWGMAMDHKLKMYGVDKQTIKDRAGMAE